MQNQSSPLLLSAAILLAGLTMTNAHAADESPADPTVHVSATRQPALSQAEAAYVVDLRDHLNAASRYPTGREASLARPIGTATVWADVSRDGRVVARGLEKSSESGILDRMAVSLVGRTRYAAMPVGGWAGTPTHRFVVSYHFEPVTDTSVGPVAEVEVQ